MSKQVVRKRSRQRIYVKTVRGNSRTQFLIQRFPDVSDQGIPSGELRQYIDASRIESFPHHSRQFFVLQDKKRELTRLVPSVPMGHICGHDDNIAFAQRLLPPLAGEQPQRLCRLRKMMDRYHVLLERMFRTFPSRLTMVLHL